MATCLNQHCFKTKVSWIKRLNSPQASHCNHDVKACCLSTQDGHIPLVRTSVLDVDTRSGARWKLDQCDTYTLSLHAVILHRTSPSLSYDTPVLLSYDGVQTLHNSFSRFSHLMHLHISLTSCCAMSSGISVCDITKEVEATLQNIGNAQGVITVMSKHTTVGITVNEFEVRLMVMIRC
jgi:hypothetical protein